MTWWRRRWMRHVGLFATWTICGCGGSGGSDAIAYRPVASVDEVMDAIVIPASQAIFDAVIYENGALVRSPATDDEWFRLRMQALAAAEAGNLLMMPGRAEDAGEWMTFARAMIDAAETVADAAESADVERLLQTGGRLYQTCAACHRMYLPEP